MSAVASDEFTSFPEYIDSTMFSAMQGCPRSFYNRFCRKLSFSEESIHLIAGGAYAKGLEILRKGIHEERLKEDDALVEAIIALLDKYGEADPASTCKTAFGMVRALVSYVQEYGSHTDKLKPHKDKDTGKFCIEHRFELELPLNHPETGKPLILVGALDMLSDYKQGVFIVDDKTTGALNGNWGLQWDMRGQFLCYAYAMQRQGYNVKGAIVRGVGIYKTMMKHQEVIVDTPQWKTLRWYNQFLATLENVIEMYKKKEFGFNFSDACNSFTGCSYKQMCNVRNEEAIVPEYNRVVWRPEIGKQEVLKLASDDHFIDDDMADAFGMR